MKLSAIFLILTMSLPSFSQDKPAYKLFTAEGKRADYEDLLKAVNKSDVVFFGELHDNPIVHWLELELTRSLFASKR